MSSSPSLPALLPPTGLLLSYALPLLFVSLCLTFAGTFLTLDRTRAFPRAYDAIVPGSFDKPARRRTKDLYQLCGGVGGLASGWCFGVHFTTFLALLVPATTKNAALNPKAFIAVWLISSIITTLFGGRWRYSAIALTGLTGGCLFSLLLSILLHPSLTTRLVLAAVFTPLILLLCLLPFPAIQYPTLRLANASTGAVGTVMSIALLAHEPNWSNPWERHWVKDGELWGSAQEKGLTAAACIFLALGIASDYILKRKFGECPDEKWDSYLSRYSANLPDRAGTFLPSRSLFDKVFGKGNSDEKKGIIFPDDHEDSKLSPQTGFLGAPPAYDLHDLERNALPRNQQAFLKKGRSQSFAAKHKNIGRKREAVKFRPIGQSDLSSDEESDDDVKTPLGPNSPYPPRPWLKSKTSVASTAATLVNEQIDYDKDLEALKKTKKGFGDKEIPDYSDGEDIADSTTAGSQTPRKVSGSSADGKGEEWSPKFLQRHSQSSVTRSSTTNPSSTTAPSSNGFKPVPATPSLIKAIDRVQAAQRQAYGPPMPQTPEGLPRLSEAAEEEADLGQRPDPKKNEAEEGETKPHGGWTSFWREVEKKNKAGRDTPLRSPTTTAQTAHDRRS